MTYHSPCPFCSKIENRERAVLQNDHAWAFLTHTPIVPGHVLICPIRCVATVDELDRDELSALFELRSRLKIALIDAFGAEGFNFAWNEEFVAGQTVSHVHLHMLPRKTGDAGILGYEPRKFLYRPGSREPSPSAELVAVARSVREAVIRLQSLPTRSSGKATTRVPLQ
ncbi:MAG: HIT domain-containing protein [Enhydrobacter sp.]|nr:MAG: HIT domain-containing protein [Enhydrobacter sp.]